MYENCSEKINSVEIFFFVLDSVLVVNRILAAYLMWKGNNMLFLVYSVTGQEEMNEIFQISNT